MKPLQISFPSAFAAEGTKFADSLAEAIRNIGLDITVERDRDRPDTQDPGATLTIIQAKPAASAIAKGIAAWLDRNHGVSLQIRRGDSEITSNVSSRDTERLIDFITKGASSGAVGLPGAPGKDDDYGLDILPGGPGKDDD
jgi:hypothetical protein